jgi:hypothetical protein
VDIRVAPGSHATEAAGLSSSFFLFSFCMYNPCFFSEAFNCVSKHSLVLYMFVLEKLYYFLWLWDSTKKYQGTEGVKRAQLLSWSNTPIALLMYLLFYRKIALYLDLFGVENMIYICCFILLDDSELPDVSLNLANDFEFSIMNHRS